jgi:hypothetical protein
MIGHFIRIKLIYNEKRDFTKKMKEGWYRWTIKGWKETKNNILDTFVANIPTTDHNWHEYKYVNKSYGEDVIRLCWPPNEMKKLFNLFDDDIASILTDSNPLDCYTGSRAMSRFTIYRYVSGNTPEKEREIRGGKKPKFFLV